MHKYLPILETLVLASLKFEIKYGLEILMSRSMRKVIETRVSHIVRQEHKLGYSPCIATRCTDECTKQQCRGLKLPNGLYPAGHRQENVIQLLQTCRAM